MSELCMPLCVLNLGGEMMYILHQRLSAHDVDALEVARVLRMMIETLTHADFLDQLGKPQEVYGWVPMIAVFERLCTASSISLNETSFSKLYEMMIMAFKHEVVNATCPSYLLATTINHLRGMRDLVGAMDGGDTAIGQLDVAEVRMLRDYGGMSQGQWLLVRQTLLAFVQTQRSKIAVLMGKGWQNRDGWIVVKPGGAVPRGSLVPGIITEYHPVDGTKTSFFDYGHACAEAPRRDPVDVTVGVLLGCNTLNEDVGVAPSYTEATARDMNGAATSLADLPRDMTSPRASRDDAVWDTVNRDLRDAGDEPPKYTQEPQTASATIFSADAESLASDRRPVDAPQGLELLSKLIGVRPVAKDDGFRLSLSFGDEATSSDATGTTTAAIQSSVHASAFAVDKTGRKSTTTRRRESRQSASMLEIMSQFDDVDVPRSAATAQRSTPSQSDESLLDLLDMV